MKRTIFAIAMVLTAGLAFAGPDILPIAGVAGTISYDLATGQQMPMDPYAVRVGPSIWAATQWSGYFWGGQGPAEIALDWGDIAPATVSGFGFAYATNADDGLTGIVGFYANDNGWNTQGRDFIAAFKLDDLAGTLTPDNRDLYWSWIYCVEPANPIVIAANDLDGDGLGDFSYTYWWDPTSVALPYLVGPLIAGDPNAGTAPGIEQGFDIYNDPNYIPAPGYFDPNLTHYVGTYWFGGQPFAQFYMELFAVGPTPGNCYSGPSGTYCTADVDGDCDVDNDDLERCIGLHPYAGCDVNGDGYIDLWDLAEIMGQLGDTCRCPRGGQSGSYCTVDIFGWDCLVNLSDLAKLLGNYGRTGMTYWDGDVANRDGTVDLADLAELLGQYGDNCNWPRP